LRLPLGKKLKTLSKKELRKKKKKRQRWGGDWRR
jgi:hypothetical protein